MKTNHLRKLLLSSVLLLGASPVAYAACDQTLNAGANVASAISSAAAGSTICLNSGSYGTANLTNITKANPVTVQSVSGNGATLSLKISGSNRLTFQNLTIPSLDISGSATKSIIIRGSTFTGQALLNMTGNSDANIVIDGNTFDGISVCSNCYEGRLDIIENPNGSKVVGVTITNNHFGGAGESDGIQISAYGVVVGPGNIFDGIVQANYGRHVDSIQLYGQSHTTITGNYFINNDVQIMAPDGGNTEVITNNVFIAKSGNNGIQLGSHTNGTFRHNTVKNITVNMDAKVGGTPSQNAVARDNIMISSNFKTVDSSGKAACTNCTIDSNLFSSSGNSKGTNAIVGTPTFVGGSSPTTWSGYQLTSTSVGYRAASDANDLGTNYYGAGTQLPPGGTQLPAPANLRIQ